MKKHYQGLGHIAIRTRDMASSIAFYEKIGGTLLQQETLEKPAGLMLLALVDLGDITLELLQPPTPASMEEGNIPHFAIYVDDVDAAAAELKAAGVDTFLAPSKEVLPTLFGGLENWFFTGPSGEQIELLRML